eukprot:11344458-Heterocapsa_arctica.AAC.1
MWTRSRVKIVQPSLGDVSGGRPHCFAEYVASRPLNTGHVSLDTGMSRPGVWFISSAMMGNGVTPQQGEHRRYPR